MIDYAIIAAMDQEANKIKDKMIITGTEVHKEKTFIFGTINNKSILLAKAV